ncbi:MAG TPA: hypothetical protein VF491_13530 [Vicinamibacterales bacterium]
MRIRIPVIAIVIACAAGLGAQSPASNQVTAGEVVIEHPTLTNIGLEWHIDGDANRNASVDTSFRKQGETAWRKALPMLRLQGEQTFSRNTWNLVAPNAFMGSVLDLEPGTNYEVRMVMRDPDGVRDQASGIGDRGKSSQSQVASAADATRTITVRTRPEPEPAEGGKTYHVYPVKWKGAKLEPAFEGIMCAYNYYCGAGDTAPGGRPRVKAGDTILVHAGTYAYHWEFYGNQTTVNATTTFEGTYYLTADGTPEKPIVIKAAGDGEVIIDGRNNFNLFNVKAGDYNYFEGITFRNTKIAIWAGTQFIAGSKGLTVKNCRFEDVGMGIFTNNSNSSDFYIADSVFLGRNDPKHLIGWNGPFWEPFRDVEGQEYPPVMESYTGIRLYGAGHVVMHNYVAGFHDGIDTDYYGMPDGSHPVDGPTYPTHDMWDRRPASIDIIGNYITNAHDNSIEMDGSMHNVRVMRNMLINSASHPMSTQPSGGGPIYFIRNIVFNAPGGSTRITNGSPGVLFYNNTVVTDTSAGAGANLHWRNNLMLSANALASVFSVNSNTSYSSSDYNGFALNVGSNSSSSSNGSKIESFPFVWNTPPAGAMKIGAEEPKLETHRYATFAEYQKGSGQDQHSVLLDYDIFVKVPRLDGKDLATVQRLYKAADLDFNLKPGSAAIDRGVELPTITDGFSGKAPDLGALEFGKTSPIYGPRTK